MSRGGDFREGFTLLEVLVALAILGVGLGVVLSGLGQSLRLRREADENIRLAIVAEHLVSGLIARQAAPEAPEEGDEGEVRWRIERVAPRPLKLGEESRRPLGTPLTEVKIAVEAPSGRRWEFLSLLPAESVSQATTP